MSIENGHRQRLCLSPILFDIYVETLTEEALGKARTVVIRGEVTKIVKYADDQTILAGSKEDLQYNMIQSIIGVGK